MMNESEVDSDGQELAGSWRPGGRAEGRFMDGVERGIRVVDDSRKMTQTEADDWLWPPLKKVAER